MKDEGKFITERGEKHFGLSTLSRNFLVAPSPSLPVPPDDGSTGISKSRPPHEQPTGGHCHPLVAPDRAAIPPPAVRSPKAGVSKEKLRVLMMSGVSEATHIPVQNPKPDARVKKLQYWEHLVRPQRSQTKTLF